MAQDRLAQSDIYNAGGAKDPQRTGSAAVEKQPVVTDTFGVQDARGSDDELSISPERKSGSPFYSNGAVKSGGSPASPIQEKSSEGSPFYTNGGSRKSGYSPGFEIQQRPGESGLDHYSGSEVRTKDSFGTELLRRPSDIGSEVYSIRETRGADNWDAAPQQKKNGGDSLFGASQISRTLVDAVTLANRPKNIQGLTGLLVTNSAFSAPADTVTIGASFMQESSSRPKFDIFQMPLTITYGITNEVELGIKAKMITIDDKSGKVPKTSSGFGDTELLLKGRIIEQQESFPAVAIGVGGILATGKESESLNEVTHWGAKFIMVTSSEAPILDGHLLGLYIEGQMVFIDEFTKYGSHTPTAERYGVINAGALMPFAFDNRLQAIIEYNAVVRKDRRTLKERNSDSLTPSFRFTTGNFSVALGAQIMNKKAAKYEDTVRFIGTVSYTF